MKGFFRWLEKTTYKMHVRVFLSRYRAYNTCPACGGRRLQPEALCWKWRGFTLPELYAMPIDRLLRDGFGRRLRPRTRQAEVAYESILTRLRYLREVGLGYLTPDRASRTLSGGEVERVNLTGCLGTSLVDTLFVMDEPSVGLHPRDIDRLVAIIRSLVDGGNTVVVVEHDEAMIRAADHVIEVGPEPGIRGGRIVFQGSVAQMLRDKNSITGEYFSGRRSIPSPGERRPVRRGHPVLEFLAATKHNVRSVDLRIPLKRFVCLSGVSGSGKSTILNNVIHQGLAAHRGKPAEDPAAFVAVHGADLISEIVLVDQGPISRTPRSNPALYVEAWDLIRELFASTAAAQAAGMGTSSFSFNSGDGRCDHCQGLGYERVEMQFLSDVYVPCPICEGKRFKPEVLAIGWNGTSVADVHAEIERPADAIKAFADSPQIRHRLSSLDSVGLGYLTLGQPLNTLSGGESQRLKLVRYLGTLPGEAGALLLPRRAHDRPPPPRRRPPPRRPSGPGGPRTQPGRHRAQPRRSQVGGLDSRGSGPRPAPRGGQTVVAEGTPDQMADAGTATSRLPSRPRFTGTPEPGRLGRRRTPPARASSPTPTMRSSSSAPGRTT